MEGPRGTKTEEFPKVIDLINKVFRVDRNHKPTMKEEFPILLTESNMENMRIIVEDNMPVSDINFVKREMLIQGAKINVASIGAVCTHPDYRCKGYSSLILDDVEKKMYEDGVDLLLVSGTRSLYQRRGCTQIKNFLKYTVRPSSEEIDFELRDYKSSDLEKIMNLYNQLSTRFYRNKDDFEKLIESAVMPWGIISYERYVICRENEVVGYIFLRVFTKENEKIAMAFETFGTTSEISKSMAYLANKHKLDNIFYMVNKQDQLNKLRVFDEVQEDFEEGTVKIINFPKFMEHLNPYFTQYIKDEELKKLKFESKEDKNIITFENESLVILDIRELNKLVFEGTSSLETEVSDCMKKLLDRIFPIPFVWVANLNYQ